MVDPTNAGTNRRDFIKTAGALGAGALAAGQGSVAGAAESAVSDPAKTALVMAQSEQQKSTKKIQLAPPDKQPPNLQVPKPVQRKIGWAVVGLGELALAEVMPAFAECRYSRPVALVSGHPDKARQVAEVYGIDKQAIYNYENYDQIANNAAVDVIYIILPNNMHAEYTIRGLKAGKHVLCEKPMAMSIGECRQMIDTANQVQKQLMIAYRLHYEPYNLKVMELCKQQAFGKIRTFSSSNCQNVQAPNIRLAAELGGGPVGDVGVYSINAARYCINEEPVEVTAVAQRPGDDPRFREVPESVAFTLKFPSGVIAHCDCSFGTGESRKYRVHCEKGYIDMDPAFSYRGLELHTAEKEGEARKKTDINLTPVNHFASEMDHLSQCILNNTPNRTPGEEGLADIRIIAAIHEAARTGQAVKVPTA